MGIGSRTERPSFGDSTITLAVQNEHGSWINLLVSKGPNVSLVSASSPLGDPAGAVISLP